ncbi:hypothetical protein [Saccharomonospora sp. NB11]|uniref:hypothetical protein n=1 Tax=Saccharomonospora sp. NB11 TaxID=1642298 RepID=UPI0018D1B948|nr:hypothetical protein [Saccharomonospora sp. NB11]
MTTLRGIVRDRLTNAVVKIYDAASSDIYGGKAAVTGHVCVDGAAALLPALCSEVERRLADVGAAMLSEEQVSADPLAAAVVKAYRGDPLGNEVIVRSALGVSTEEADERGRGWIFVLPFVPFTPGDLVRARGVVRDAAPPDPSVQVGTTVNTLDHDVVDLVIAVRFDRRDPTSVTTAHHTLDRLYEGLVEAGYHPYRLDTAHRRSDVLPDTDLTSTLARRIKSAVDPANVFGGSRYFA